MACINYLLPCGTEAPVIPTIFNQNYFIIYLKF